MSPVLPHHITLRTLLNYGAILVIVSLFIMYVLFQARLIIAGPEITITTPNGPSSERVITLEGYAENIVTISLNGRTIYTNERGYFKEAIVLENGYTVATVRAKDRYGRIVTADRSFVYTPLTTDNS